MSDICRKRGESRRRMVESICYVALGILLYWAWHLFQKFEGPAAAMGPLPHDHPMHRVVEAVVFLAVALVPLVVYFILRIRSRSKKGRGTR